MVARLQRHQHRAPDNFLKQIFNVQWKVGSVTGVFYVVE